MPASEREAGRLWGSRGTAEQSTHDAPSIRDDEQQRKQASCDTQSIVSAWARWRSAVRIAIHALGRGPR